jgi:hypothetical protein
VAVSDGTWRKVGSQTFFPVRSPKTFFLDCPKHYLDKLEWEINCLKAMRPSEMKEKAYQILTCATTAWHLCDWVYEAMTAEQRASHCNGRDTLGGFQKWACDKCTWLKLCRQIAVANKHFVVKNSDDPRVGTDQVMMSLAGKSFQSEPAFTIDGKWISPAPLLEKVMIFWRQLLQELNMFWV